MELLLKNYFVPRNADNQKLKQCLSFFFQAYCASSVDNQRMISSVCLSLQPQTKYTKSFNLYQIFLRSYCDLCKISAELEDDEEMASMAQIADVILDWTHPNTLL